MAINKYTRSSRFSPDTTDPITKARIANPDKMGKVNPQGNAMVTSWPELRKAYERGELPSDLLTGGRGDIPQDVISYMKGETDKLSERYAEPEYVINPDTQEVSTIRNIGDQGYKEGDTLTDKPSEAGKKNVGFLRYAADNPANKAMINRGRSSAKSYGTDLKDVIQGDSVAAGQSDSPYSEEEMAALYPDMQIGAGDSLGMSNFGQSAYRESKAQKKKREEGIAIRKEAEKKLEKFDEEGIVPLPFKGVGRLGRRPRKRDLPDLEANTYEDPRMPSRGKRDVFKGDRIKYANKGKRDNNTGSDRRRFRKEERLAKATYGRGLEQKSEGELDERKAILKERKREQMSPFKRDPETNKITGLNRPQLFKNLAVNQSARREIRDINRAKRYSKMVGGEQRVGISDRSLTDNQKKGGPQYFTPEQMTGYRDSKSNPLNRNSVASRFKR